ncbi:penicillin-binding protein 1C [Sulfuritalea sp.]|uniref:penicillin-binding protein 1C n=1 Tax=Sulfuritalea sp. TaxID=2480090 RepID=UPI001AC7C155|nr:penicillin-binding protein 1C [Sulfuritalea sp.]MBN8474566.1 penicillin-binding protein 1C [Sulfuritalea sp.]
MWRHLRPLAALALLMPSLSAMALPGFSEVRAAHRPSDAWLLARDGTPIAALRLDRTVRRLPWVPLGEIAPALRRAVLASEDKRFLEHAGVDWQAAAAGAWSNLRHEKTRGASTISMQLAGLLDAESRRKGRRKLVEKLDQAAAALRLEQSWSKNQILEAYLNLAPFRGELEGVAAMSRGLFGKWPQGLDEQEAALAAALLRAPNAGAAVVARRACALLREMRREALCHDLDAVAATTLANVLHRADQTPPLAPHLAQKLLTRPGERRRSTLDADLQRFADETLRRHLRALDKHKVEDGAVLVADNATGEILAWVGSSGELSDAAAVDGVTALRQAGSTLKPFLYGMAFARRDLTAASLIEDAPLTLATGNGLYAPQNYEPEHRGWISARTALAASLNVPAVKTLVRLGADEFQQGLRRFGFDSLTESGDWYGYSLALGSADVSLLALANAYRTLANAGRWSALRATPDANAAPCRGEHCGAFAGAPRQALAATASFLVGDILADRAARAGSFGLESWLATPYWSAAKTGTSKDMRDNWCAGYSRRYTVAVWVGNASGAAMHEVSGIAGAAPVWREVMDWLHRGDDAGRRRTPSAPPAAPPGLIARDVRFESSPRVQAEPPRREWFIAGTERSIVRVAAQKSLARIRYPAQGTVIALDPDIPPGRQRLPLQLSSRAETGWQWRMDGKPAGRAGRSNRWLPQPGKHRLALVDATEVELDAVSFEVRALRGKRRDH